MFDRTWIAATMAVLLVGSAGLVGATAGTSNAQPAVADAGAQADISGYTHVSANVTSDAIVDYRVGGTTVLESVKVQSQSKVQSETGVSVGADVSAVTNFAGAGLSASARTETSATVTAESGATLRAHDNGHGTLVVAAGSEDQYVGMNLSSSASVESESDERVVATTDDGTKASVLVAGEGTVTVNDSGNVTADLESDSRLVVRTYEERDENARQQEEMIVNGTAAAQVYLTQTAESGSGAAVDVVDYGQEASVEVTQRAEGTVEMTVERSASQGKVVITSVSEETFETAEDVQVRVDGEAAAQASTYSELAAAADGGSTSKYMVRQSTSARASADVYVALNHFSERNVTMEESDSDGADDGTTDDSTADDGTEDTDGDAADDTESDAGTAGGSGQSGPGFTVVLAVLAVAAAIGLGVGRN